MTDEDDTGSPKSDQERTRRHQPPADATTAGPVAEVISIGDEMTSGARTDTNSAWLSRRLGALGIHARFHTTVGDSMPDNLAAFRAAVDRADVVVTTGGLGPTRDDLTRDVLAELVAAPLEFRESACRRIEELFRSRGRVMSERNRVQAMFPIGSHEIFNPHGTAPGVDVIVPRDDGTTGRVFALPGVPAEMKPMFDETVATRILQRFGGGRKIRHAVMKFFGTGESEMEARLGEMIARGRQPLIGITASAATISLRVTAAAETEDACQRLIAQARQEIMGRVGEFYFGDGESFEQHHAVDAELRRRGETLVVVELGYAAPLGDRFATLGETDGYRGGLSLATKPELMRIAATHSFDNAVNWVRDRFQADWVLVVDEYPPVTPDASPDAVRVSLLVDGPGTDRRTAEIELGGHPNILHARIAKSALRLLREAIASAPDTST